MPNFNLNSGYGALLADKVVASVSTAGKTFLVCPSTHPNFTNLQQLFIPDPDGTSRIFTTLVAAAAATTASRDDVIFVAEGHTETFSSATAITLSTAGVRIIGMGVGSLRPTFTLDTANTATINVTAANIRFENCIFVANFLAIASLFTLTTAKEFQLVNCEVRDTSSVLNFVTVVTTAATSNGADGLTISGCKFYLLATTGATKLVSAVGTNDRWTITNNFYSTPTTGTGAVIPVATGKAITNLILDGNKFILVQTTGTSTGILLTADTAGSGYVSNNLVQTAATTPLCVTAARTFVQTNNLFTHSADKSGYVMPVIDASS